MADLISCFELALRFSIAATSCSCCVHLEKFACFLGFWAPYKASSASFWPPNSKRKLGCRSKLAPTFGVHNLGSFKIYRLGKWRARLRLAGCWPLELEPDFDNTGKAAFEPFESFKPFEPLEASERRAKLALVDAPDKCKSLQACEPLTDLLVGFRRLALF